MITLPEPNFIERDPAKVTTELVQLYEHLTKKPLQPAQVERVMIDVIAYRETLLRIAIQEAAKQNLARYAMFPMLDYIGQIVGVERIEAMFARTTLRFTLTAAQSVSILVATGTRVESKDGKHIFATTENLTIPAGQTTGDVTAVAQTAGIDANGYLPGDIQVLLDPVAWVGSVTNVTDSSWGSEIEDDEHLRERIFLAPESFSTAGSKAGYRFHALKAHPSMVDVAITRGADGTVNIYPLTTTGTPSAEVLDLVEAAVSDEKVRPLSDLVNVAAPTKVDFNISATVILYTTADAATVQAEIARLLDAYKATMKSKLGKDIVPSQITSIIGSVTGVYKVDLTAPAFQVLTPAEWANCVTTTVTITGVADG